MVGQLVYIVLNRRNGMGMSQASLDITPEVVIVLHSYKGVR